MKALDCMQVEMMLLCQIQFSHIKCSPKVQCWLKLTHFTRSPALSTGCDRSNWLNYELIVEHWNTIDRYYGIYRNSWRAKGERRKERGANLNQGKIADWDLRLQKMMVMRADNSEGTIIIKVGQGASGAHRCRAWERTNMTLSVVLVQPKPLLSLNHFY